MQGVTPKFPVAHAPPINRWSRIRIKATEA